MARHAQPSSRSRDLATLPIHYVALVTRNLRGANIALASASLFMASFILALTVASTGHTSQPAPNNAYDTGTQTVTYAAHRERQP